MAKRLNKNLVAFLTATGIILAVVVVAIAAYNATRRDPELVAAKAQAYEKDGDLERAVRTWKSAYDISQDPKYLIEAARCAHEMGELGQMFSLLNFAHAQAPNDPKVLTAVLERYWELRGVGLGQWRDVLDRAESLLSLEPTNLLALVSKSDALEQLKADDPSYAAEGDAALNRAVELDPTSPYVAIVRAERRQLRANQQAGELFQSRGREAAEDVMAQALTDRIGYLEPALAAHPEDSTLRTALAQALAENQDFEGGQHIVEAGLTRDPDKPELHFALARLLLQQIQRRMQEGSAEEIRQMVDTALEHTNKAIELEPALYRAYTTRADLQELGWIKDGTWDTDCREREKVILESLAAALRDTVGLRSLRATLGPLARLDMITAAFNRALRYHHIASDDAVKSQALTYLRMFHQEAQTQYPEYAVVPLMEGYIALIDDDDRLAVKSFTEAEARAARPGAAPEYGQFAKEELVKLYRKLGELGLSLRYTVDAIDTYRKQLRVPPRGLYINQIEVLEALGREQEALDLVESIAPQYPDDPVMATVRGRILTELGRSAEAARWLRQTDSDTVPLIVEKARIAALNEDYTTAETLLRQALATRPEHLPAIRMLMQVLLATNRADEAKQLIEERLASATDARMQRVLRSYQVMLSTDDPEQRRQQLLALIAEIPDEFDRAAEYFNFWANRSEYERAASYLDQMEHLAKDPSETMRVLELQFDLALRRDDCPRAASYVTALAEKNVDQADGALFRGRYELRCGAPEKALNEFRAAERALPSNSSLKIFTAQALLMMKPPRYDDAVRTLEQAVDFDPSNFAARKMLYVCYEETGRHAQAVEQLKEAQRINPDDDFVKQNALLLQEQEDPKFGIERREKLRAEKPDDAINLLRLAELYERPEVANPTLAQQRLQEALAADPANAKVAQFGMAFFARHQEREAGEQFLRKHLEAQKGTGEIVARLLLGRFYSLLNDNEAALGAYQQARERAGALSPDDPDARRNAMALTMSELGNFYRSNQQYQQMIDAYRVMLTYVQPDNTYALQTGRRNIMQGLLALRKYGDAEKEIASYRKDYPDDPAGMMSETDLLLARNKLDEARELLSRVLELDPDNAWARYTRGEVLIRLGRYTEARDDLLRAKTVAPDAFKLRHRLDLARLYDLMEQPQLAEAELRELLPLDRGDNREVELRLIDLLRNSAQPERAEQFLNELRARDPKQPFWPYQLGKLLAARGEYAAAIQYLQEAAEMTQSKNPEILAEWLSALLHGNRAQEATQIYDNLPPQLLTPRIQCCAAEAYLAQKNRPVAIALLEQATQTASLVGVVAVRDVINRAIKLLGDEEGLALLRRMLGQAANPKADLAVRSTLARYLATSEDAAQHAEGLELAKQVIAAAPEKDPLHQEALLVEALALDKMGKPDQAVQTYEELLRIKPDNAGALNNLAYLLADNLNRAAEALPYAQQLYDVAPEQDKSVFLDTVGWVYFKNDQADQAEAVLLEALRLAPDYLAARYHLGQVYLSAGNRASAERAFRRVDELAQTQQDKEYAQKAQEALDQLRR